MSISLGDFGEERDRVPLDATFQWFGQTVRVSPEASELDLIEFMGAAGHLDEDDIGLIPALHQLLRAYVHTEDWPQFWRASRKNGAQVSDFMALVRAVTEVAAGRPTGRPSSSSDGPPSTGSTSTGAWRSEEVRALRLLKDRPDLAVVVVDRHEAGIRAAATG